jgi:hypothetical protein
MIANAVDAPVTAQGVATASVGESIYFTFSS